MKKFNITVNGNQYEVEVEEIKDGVPANSRVEQSQPRVQTTSEPAQKAQVIKTETKKPVVVGELAASIKAPMPGTINDIKVSEGQNVKSGDVLIILEAMKMENELMSPKDGIVKQIVVSKGASVSSGDVLVVVQ